MTKRGRMKGHEHPGGRTEHAESGGAVEGVVQFSEELGSLFGAAQKKAERWIS